MLKRTLTCTSVSVVQVRVLTHVCTIINVDAHKLISILNQLATILDISGAINSSIVAS